MSKNLIEYAFNRFSQHGEDGVIEEICARLGVTRGWFVEFGAWDGKHLSNSYNLLLNHQWQGLDIEADPKRYQDLLSTQAKFPGRLHTLRAMVGFKGEHELDKLLAPTPLPQDFDLLSIDIDSYDYQVWEALQNYRPKIVVIECSGELPPGVRRLHSPPEFIGASFSSMVDLGKRKAYQLVCHTGNCIFVANELVSQLQLDPVFLQAPEKLFNRGKHFRATLIRHARRFLPEPALHGLFKASYKWKQLRNRR